MSVPTVRMFFTAVIMGVCTYMPPKRYADRPGVRLIPICKSMSRHANGWKYFRIRAPARRSKSNSDMMTAISEISLLMCKN